MNRKPQDAHPPSQRDHSTPPPEATPDKAEWTCGHVAGAVCQECWRELAAKAHELAEENLRMRERIEELERKEPH